MRNQRGFSTVGALILIVVLAFAVAMFLQWQKAQHQDDLVRRTVDGFTTIFEGLYAWRVENPARWTSSFLELTIHTPNLQILDAAHAGANGFGNPYTLDIVGGTGMLVRTIVNDELTARAVVLEFGSSASYANVGTHFEVTVGLPVPGNVSLINSTVLIDGSTKLKRPLWVETGVVLAGLCDGNGVGITAAGEVLACRSYVWSPL